ncbi:MAG: translation initiation factor IF-2 [Chloroflexi bacterium]|nr:translation initiation factor IF-2 [Chloroflexota bacterium]
MPRLEKPRPTEELTTTSSTPATSAAESAEKPPQKSVELPKALTVKQLSDLLEISPVDIIKQLMRNGVMASINQIIDFDTAAVVAADLGFEAKELPKGKTEAITSISGKRVGFAEDIDSLKPRPPVVTILGHVDHGKTTLLDAIRESNVIATEAGGITQHIGAYQVEVHSQKITFLDTPGHEAFTAMRARGAQATDIAVLVVAADDGVMPQTVEAIDHAKAAGVPIIVAINKIDKPGANPDRIKQQLSDHSLLAEDWGGNTITVPVSAKKREGISDLLESILLVAEMAELKANPNRPATGVILEAKLDTTKGPLATVLVQSGTLEVGDCVVVGETWGKLKAMFNDKGKRIKKAEPSTPVEILGLNNVPQAGDTFVAVFNERTAKEQAQERQGARERAASQPLKPRTMEQVLAQIRAGEIKELNVILKTDVQGSVEPIQNSLERLEAEKAKVKIIHTGSGSVSESDVLLAVASKAMIIGFNTHPEPGAVRLAEAEGVSIRLHSIIYELVEDVNKALAGLLEPTFREVIEGHAEVRAVFQVKKTRVAGVFVTDGKITRDASARVLRGGKAVYASTVTSLKHFKEDVKELSSGFEGGIGIEGFGDIQVGDIIEAYRKERVG